MMPAANSLQITTSVRRNLGSRNSWFDMLAEKGFQDEHFTSVFIWMFISLPTTFIVWVAGQLKRPVLANGKGFF